MRAFSAFFRKEITAQIRSGKLMILGILFVLFGVMNPAVAKLTPWLLETMADSLAESGMTVTAVTVSAMDSWVQFFKNIPMALIAFVLLESSIFTGEYRSGTLVLSLCRGLRRETVVLTKSTLLLMLWSAGYWLCFGITYGYNAYFWDNSIAQSLGLSVVCWWLFGVFIIALTLFFSTLSAANTGVLVGTGGVVFVSSMLAFFPDCKPYLPTALADGYALIYGTAERADMMLPLCLTAALSLLLIAVSIPIFNKKQF